MPELRNKVTITKLESDIMEWTLEKLDKLEEQIEQLYQTTELSENTLADVMGKIDTERFKVNQANGVVTGDELVLPIQNVSKSFNSLLDRLEKCFNADSQEAGNIFDKQEAISGWKDEQKALEDFIKEKESELNVC